MGSFLGDHWDCGRCEGHSRAEELDSGNGDEFVLFNPAGNDAEIALKRAGLDVALFDGVVVFQNPGKALVLVEAEGGVLHEQALGRLADRHADAGEKAGR